MTRESSSVSLSYSSASMWSSPSKNVEFAYLTSLMDFWTTNAFFSSSCNSFCNRAICSSNVGSLVALVGAAGFVDALVLVSFFTSAFAAVPFYAVVAFLVSSAAGVVVLGLLLIALAGF